MSPRHFALLALLVLGCPKPDAPPPPKPERHCFTHESSTMSVTGHLELDAAGNVKGQLDGFVIDEPEDQRLPYRTTFEGRREGDALVVKTKGAPEAPDATSTERWVWKQGGRELGLERIVLNETVCPKAQ